MGGHKAQSALEVEIHDSKDRLNLLRNAQNVNNSFGEGNQGVAHIIHH